MVLKVIEWLNPLTGKQTVKTTILFSRQKISSKGNIGEEI